MLSRQKVGHGLVVYEWPNSRPWNLLFRACNFQQNYLFCWLEAEILWNLGSEIPKFSFRHWNLPSPSTTMSYPTSCLPKSTTHKRVSKSMAFKIASSVDVQKSQLCCTSNFRTRLGVSDYHWGQNYYMPLFCFGDFFCSYCRDQPFCGSGKMFPGINFWKLLILLRDRPCLELIIISSNFQAFLLLQKIAGICLKASNYSKRSQ